MGNTKGIHLAQDHRSGHHHFAPDRRVLARAIADSDTQAHGCANSDTACHNNTPAIANARADSHSNGNGHANGDAHPANQPQPTAFGHTRSPAGCGSGERNHLRN
jgi:hypothetical protein